MGVSIVGVVAALLVFKNDTTQKVATSSQVTSNDFEGGFDGDE